MGGSDGEDQVAAKVHEELLGRLALLAGAEERLEHLTDIREAARGAVGASLRRARAVLELTGADPDLELARDLYWNTRVRVEDLGRYLGVRTGQVHAAVGPDGERACPTCDQVMPARSSRVGRARPVCRDCETRREAASSSRWQQWETQRRERDEEYARQYALLLSWLEARGGVAPSTIFEVPGVSGFWILGADGSPEHVEVARAAEEGGYVTVQPRPIVG